MLHYTILHKTTKTDLWYAPFLPSELANLLVTWPHDFYDDTNVGFRSCVDTSLDSMSSHRIAHVHMNHYLKPSANHLLNMPPSMANYSDTLKQWWCRRPPALIVCCQYMIEYAYLKSTQGRWSLKCLVFWTGPLYLIGMWFGKDQRANIMKTHNYKRLDYVFKDQ